MDNNGTPPIEQGTTQPMGVAMGTVTVPPPILPDPAKVQADINAEQGAPATQDPNRNNLGQFVPGNTSSIGNQGGRPCEYCKDKDEIDRKTKEYLDECESKTKPKIPFIQELAMILDCGDKYTITDWADKRIKDSQGKQTETLEHPEFSLAIKKLRNMQETRLLQRTLGRYNPTGAIFQLKTNHRYIETEKQILAGDKDSAPIQVEIIEEEKKKFEDESDS